MGSSPSHWQPPSWLLGALLHLFVGVSVPLAALVRGYPGWWGGAAILGVAAAKEFTFDRWVEGQELRGNLQDLLMYLLGVLAALVLIA